MNFIRELYENNKKQFHIGILLLILLILLIVIHTMTKRTIPKKKITQPGQKLPQIHPEQKWTPKQLRFLPGHRIPETPNLRP